MHWSSLRSAEYTSLAPLTLRNQIFHPLVGFGQDLKVSFHSSREKFLSLNLILLVYAFIRMVGSELPIGPEHWMWGWSVGRSILSLSS